MAAWPSTLPVPQIQGYQLSPAPQTQRTEVEAGHARVRRRSFSRSDMISVAWEFTDAQMEAFRIWFDVDVLGGAEWFTVTLASGDMGLRSREARFSGAWEATPLPGLNWSVSANLETKGGELAEYQTKGAVMGLVTASGEYPSMALDFAADQKLDSHITFARTSEGTYFDEAGVMRTAPANAPRFHFDPITHANYGLLIEGYRTNYIFNTASTATAAVVSTGTATGPNGALAYKVIPNAGAVSYPSRGGSTQGFAITTTEGQTTDVALTGYFAAYGPLNYKPYLVFVAHISGASHLYATVRINAVTGEITGKTLNAGWSDVIAPVAVLMPCGMWRVTWILRFTQPALLRTAIYASFQISNEADVQVYTADGASGVQYACMQFEPGSFPSSYIPTTTAAANRQADAVSMSGTNFSSWWNGTEGTFFIKANSEGDIVSPKPFAFCAWTYGEGETQDNVRLTRNGSAFDSTLYTGAVSQAYHYGFAGQLSNWASAKAAYAFKANDTTLSTSGTLETVDTACTLPTGLDRLNIGSGPVANREWFGCIQQLAFFPKRIIDSELAVMTRA